MERVRRRGCGVYDGTERVACVLRLAVGILVVVMTISFEPLVHWLAVTAAVTSIGWSLLMGLALSNRLDHAELAKLATGSYWFDLVLPLVVFAVFLTDPVATPVAGLPLLVFRLTMRYGRPGAWGGAAVFVGLIVVRIVVNRMFIGEGLVRPPLLLAWALVATLAVVLALELRHHPVAEEIPDTEQEPRSLDRTDRLRPTAAASTGDGTLDTLAAGLAMRLDVSNEAVKLTQREQEILILLGQGRSYSSIAGSLFIAVGTVRNHVHNIRHKLGISEREELLALAREVAARLVPAPAEVRTDESDRSAGV